MTARSPAVLADKPWLNGEPYYCDTCGCGLSEYMACEDGDCKLESREKAQQRMKANERP